MRRIVVLLVAVLAVMALALPVLAQTEPPSAADGITVEGLATVAGAVVVSGVIVAFAGVLFSLSSRAKRVLAAVAGLAIVVVGTVLNGGTGFATYVLAVFTGMSAGLAAAKAQEIGSEGLNHSVTRRSP